MIVLVLRILAQEQVFRLQVLVHHLVVVQLADRVREVGDLRHALQDLVVGKLGLERPVERATLDEFHLQVGVPSGEPAAKALYHALDVRGADEVVDADFVLECAQEHVQAVEPVLARCRPELAYLHDDLAFSVVLLVVRVFDPEVRAVEVVRALESQRLDELDFLHGAAVQEFRVLVEPPLVFLHAIVRAQREVARHPVQYFRQDISEHVLNLANRGYKTRCRVAAPCKISFWAVFIPSSSRAPS